eukprot:CAMPEP_0114231330 /NCGR_PEP_ID=MMETSP0058-20121206/3977_1 /TAXON_ID=36894 /ORGANISM="Pyramimonas parkeae, CCMP726" /LENGTH=112 /DNA_ID=CAMNT_0001342653 /DNA_START=443 /DNA_END=781 /DNA_ORIENTATION=+
MAESKYKGAWSNMCTCPLHGGAVLPKTAERRDACACRNQQQWGFGVMWHSKLCSCPKGETYLVSWLEHGQKSRADSLPNHAAVDLVRQSGYAYVHLARSNFGCGRNTVEALP